MKEGRADEAVKDSRKKPSLTLKGARSKIFWKTNTTNVEEELIKLLWYYPEYPTS